MRWVRVRFNVSIGPYIPGELYDVEDVEEIHMLAEGGLADIIPYPERVSSQVPQMTLFDGDVNV